jgi:hypothetical protein
LVVVRAAALADFKLHPLVALLPHVVVRLVH